ncbi:IS30 family transposase [Actinocorallia sp. B10E7]|uniref:IS30 family transposase n=1 Tax=Actinocorallia sp. B10E7 TaxID=3153558 RepID=UPI00325FD360
MCLTRPSTALCSSKASTEGQQRGRIRDAVTIHECPAEVEDRAVPGHWEGDLITGARNSHITTLVERKSRFLLLVAVNGKDTTSVVSALTRQVQLLPDGLVEPLTWDLGTELADHKRFTDVAPVSRTRRKPGVRRDLE